MPVAKQKKNQMISNGLCIQLIMSLYLINWFIARSTRLDGVTLYFHTRIVFTNQLTSNLSIRGIHSQAWINGCVGISCYLYTNVCNPSYYLVNINRIFTRYSFAHYDLGVFHCVRDTSKKKKNQNTKQPYLLVSKLSIVKEFPSSW